MRIKDRNIYLLLGLFILVHIVLYNLFGIVTQNEAEKYIKQADLLLKGEFPSSPKYYYYLPIIYLIAFAQKLSLGYGFVVLAQSCFSAFAFTCFYKGTARVFSTTTALIASVLLCLFLPFFSWNFHLYSESIFISLSLVLYYLICRFEEQHRWTLIAIFCTVIAMIFTRPFGVLFIPPLFIYFLFRNYKNNATRLSTILCSLAFVALMFIFINKIFHGGEDMDAMKPFKEEHIICFVPLKPQGANLDLHYYDNGIKDIAYYITHNPKHFLTLMTKRLASFFNMMRPWYSRAHNTALLLFISPIYLMAFVGFVASIKKWKNAFFYFIALVVLYPLAVTFQCDDWNGRFTMLVLPPIFAFAAAGLIFTVNKIRRLH